MHSAFNLFVFPNSMFTPLLLFFLNIFYERAMSSPEKYHLKITIIIIIVLVERQYFIHGWNEMSFLLTNNLSCLSGVTVLYTWFEWDVVDKRLVLVERQYFIHGWNEMSCLLFWLLTNNLSCLSGVTVLYTWLEWDVVHKPLVLVERQYFIHGWNGMLTNVLS